MYNKTVTIVKEIKISIVSRSYPFSPVAKAVTIYSFSKNP